MQSVYDEVEIEDMDFDTETQIFYYPCPCGDKFQITLVNQILLIISYKSKIKKILRLVPHVLYKLE
jgi:hypothetical protein